MTHLIDFLTASSTSGGNGTLPDMLIVLSKAFVKAEKNGDATTMERVSHEAWAILRQLALIVRHAEDAGTIASSSVPADTGFIAHNLSLADQQAMLAQKRVNRRHAHARPLGLRDCLNKVAHSLATTYRVDGRGTHYVVLSGPDQGVTRGPWVAEFAVNRLANHAAEVIALLPPT